MMAIVIGIVVCSFKKHRIPLLPQKGNEVDTMIEFQVRPASNLFLRHLKGNFTDFDSNRDLKNQVHKLPYNKMREINRDSFRIEDEIGSGNFGKVYKGTLIGLMGNQSTTPVAIKSIKEDGSSNDIINLLSEIKLMSHISPHPNLVNMIGSCTTDLQENGDLWLLIEFCEFGDFKQYLQDNKTELLTNSLNRTLNSRCLIMWSYEIAKGMEYLAENKIMHGDLSARNILLATNPYKKRPPLAKVGDFGLAKHFYDYVKYEKSSRILVPWKWMAVEFLKYDFFTLQSDVWSFGVLVWEIFSFGGNPYGQQHYEEVLARFETGYRLPCPNEVKQISSWSPEALYQDISKNCFVAEPELRATFSDVIQIIEKQLTSKDLTNFEKMKNVYQNTLADKYVRFTQN